MLYCSNICMKFSTFFDKLMQIHVWCSWVFDLDEKRPSLAILSFGAPHFPSLCTLQHMHARTSVAVWTWYTNMFQELVKLLEHWRAADVALLFGIFRGRGLRSSFLTGHTQTARKKVSKVHSGPGITEGRGFAVVAGLWSWALFLTEIATTTMCASRTS
jgi:hypothetical protein